MFKSVLNEQFLHCLLYGEGDQLPHKVYIVRKICTVLLGLLMGALLWLVLSIHMPILFGFLEPVVFPAFVVIIAVIYFISRNGRAFILLIFVLLVGTAGRTYLRATALALVVAGPISNVATNTAEVARVFTCCTILTYNLTKTRFNLMAKPFTNTLKHMKENVNEISDTFKELDDILKDVKYGVEHASTVDDLNNGGGAENSSNLLFADFRFRLEDSKDTEIQTPEEVQRKFVQNMEGRCKQQLEQGQHVCENIFREGYIKCKSNFPSLVAAAICWPYRVTVICKLDIFGDPDEVCNASQVVPKDFGQNYVNLLETEKKLYNNDSDIQIKYVHRESMLDEGLKTAEELAKEFAEEFDKHKRRFDAVMFFVEILLYFVVFRLIFGSFRYLIYYRTSIEFDNHYITDYFRHLDERRIREQKTSILPIRSYERNEVVDLSDWRNHSRDQKYNKIFYLLQLFLEIVVALLFIFLDYLLVTILQIVHDRSLIEYSQEGEHEVRFQVKGKGMMARLLRTTMKNFNIHESVTTSLSNEECLPEPNILSIGFYIKLLLIYISLLFLTFYANIALRYRRLICSYFFYEREKQRILYFYNRILRERNMMLYQIETKAIKNSVNRKICNKMHHFLGLRIRAPAVFSWLRKFPCGQYSCCICDILEDKTFYVCPKCGMAYCQECLTYLKYLCLKCKVPPEPLMKE